MSNQLLTVLWIAAVGTSILFIALTGLVALMYLLTAPWLHPRRAARHGRRPVITAQTPVDRSEHDRRARAAAVAVALASAEMQPTVLVEPDEPSAWRVFHRAARLAQPVIRRKSRS